MKISDLTDILKTELKFKRTPSGRSITEYACNGIEATLEDEKNLEMDAIRCINCGIILSGLLVPEGCINCGSKDLTADI